MTTLSWRCSELVSPSSRERGSGRSVLASIAELSTEVGEQWQRGKAAVHHVSITCL